MVKRARKVAWSSCILSNETYNLRLEERRTHTRILHYSGRLSCRKSGKLVVRRSHLTITLILAGLVALGASLALLAKVQERSAGEDSADSLDKGQERAPAAGEESEPE